MSTVHRDELWRRLRDAGLVEGALPDRGAAPAPWFVRVMLGCAAWIGALFLLGFVGMGLASVLESATVSLLVGAGTCTMAAVIFHSNWRGDFGDQFGLAVSLAGQALMVFGLVQWFDWSLSGIALAVAVQQALLFLSLPNFIHRVWTSWSAAYAASLALGDIGLYAFAPAAVTAGCLAVWLYEFAYTRRGDRLRAGGYGLALAAVQTAVLYGELWYARMALRSSQVAPGGEFGAWAGALAGGVVLLWAVVTLLRREGLALASGPGKIALAGAAILGLASIEAPGVGPATAVLVVGYANGNRVLVGLGIAALLGYLSYYYYSLQATLLEKSAILAATGLALLIARLLLHHWWPPPERRQAETSHA